MRDPDLVQRAERAAIALERAWGRWRVMHGLTADPPPPVSSYVGYSLQEPWGQPRVVFGIGAADAEQLAAFLDGHDCVGPVYAEVTSRPDWRRSTPGSPMLPDPAAAAGQDASSESAVPAGAASWPGPQGSHAWLASNLPGVPPQAVQPATESIPEEQAPAADPDGAAGDGAAASQPGPVSSQAGQRAGQADDGRSDARIRQASSGVAADFGAAVTSDAASSHAQLAGEAGPLAGAPFEAAAAVAAPQQPGIVAFLRRQEEASQSPDPGLAAEPDSAAPGLVAPPPVALPAGLSADDVHGQGGPGYRGPRYQGFPPQYQPEPVAGPLQESGRPAAQRTTASEPESGQAAADLAGRAIADRHLQQADLPERSLSRQVSRLGRSRRQASGAHEAASWPQGEQAADTAV